jgi:TrpR family trp operon transcriptional repressor
MTEQDDHNAIEELARVLASTDDKELIEDFLHRILTPNELHSVASRWALTKLISQGMSQRKIAERLGLSLCKITRGSKELKAENSSFRTMIDIDSQLGS